MLARASPQADIVEHPMILNDIALWHMDAVHRQMEPAETGLTAAYDALNIALTRMDETKSRFRWPIDTQSRLLALASEFYVTLPEFMSPSPAPLGAGQTP